VSAAHHTRAPSVSWAYSENPVNENQ